MRESIMSDPNNDSLPEDIGQLRCVINSMKTTSDDPSKLIGGRTTLYVAAKMGFLELMKSICEEMQTPSSLINMPMPKSESTSMHACCFNKHVDCVLYLLEIGGDCNVANNYKETPFLNALQGGSQQVLGRILPHVSKSNFEKSTELLDFTSHLFGGKSMAYILARGGHTDFLRLITERAVNDVFVQNNSTKKHNNLMQLLDSKSDDNAAATPLHGAAFNGHTGCCELLLHHGCIPDEINGLGESPLTNAIQGNHCDIVLMLLPLTSLTVIGQTLPFLEGDPDVPISTKGVLLCSSRKLK